MFNKFLRRQEIKVYIENTELSSLGVFSKYIEKEKLKFNKLKVKC